MWIGSASQDLMMSPGASILSGIGISPGYRVGSSERSFPPPRLPHKFLNASSPVPPPVGFGHRLIGRFIITCLVQV